VEYKEAKKINDTIQKSKNKKAIKKNLYRLWHIAVFKSEGKKCVLCGRPAVDSHHIIRRSQSLNLAFSVMNGVPLCKNCHKFNIHTGDIDRGLKSLKNLRAYIGKGRYEYLIKNKRILFKSSLSNLRQKSIELLKFIEE